MIERNARAADTKEEKTNKQKNQEVVWLRLFGDLNVIAMYISTSYGDALEPTQHITEKPTVSTRTNAGKTSHVPLQRERSRGDKWRWKWYASITDLQQNNIKKN